jgi:hypothetical protein
MWWARFDGRIFWADWNGPCHDFYIEDEVTLPEGIAFYYDPQVNVGNIWGLFNPDKEVK